jgi:ComF family protein
VALLNRALSLVVPPFCWACGDVAPIEEPLCRPCRAGLRWLDRMPVDLAGVETWAPVAYEGPARAVVGAFKFRGAAGLADPMAAQIVAAAPPGFLDPRSALVPVPLLPSRARRRGYNQAERLAGAIARRTEVVPADCLIRRGPAGARQVGRGRWERLRGITGAVALKKGARCPSEVVLVDDVVTTGATLSACAAALSAAGARRVVALAYARTPGR